MTPNQSFPFVVAAASSALVVGAVAVLAPTDSLVRVAVVDCGTTTGYLFGVGLLALVGFVLRFLLRVLYYIWAARDGIQYEQVDQQPAVSEEQQLEEEDASTDMESATSTATSIDVRLDGIMIVILYLVLCWTARASWAPPAFRLPDIDHNTSLPPTLLLGAATSSYQVEGHIYNNQWAQFENTTTHNMEHCGEAADMWNRFEEDLTRMNDLHLDAFRLSIEWARVEPQQGVFDPEALNHYEKWLRLLQDHGIKTIVTLHHFTNPIWFEELHAFENASAPSLIVPYVKKVVQQLDPYVDYWITLNEIMVYAGNGYLMGDFPPGKSGQIGTMFAVVQNMLKCHQTMHRAIHDLSPNARVSLAKNTILYHPHSYWDLFAVVSAAASDLYYNKLPIRFLQKHNDNTLDYLGLNTYFRLQVGWMGASMGFVLPPEQQSDMGWDLEPQVLYQVLHQYHNYAPDLDILITEHGVADGESPDLRRIHFLRDSLRGMAVAANEDDIPIIGYMHWSLLSNFEWSSGYAPDFGLYRIHLPYSQERNLTEGGRLYKEIIATRRIPTT